MTGVLGYFRARDALEKAVFDQLTTARQSKARQIETYFDTIQAAAPARDLKMVVDATREFQMAMSSSTGAASRRSCDRSSATGTTRTSSRR